MKNRKEQKKPKKWVKVLVSVFVVLVLLSLLAGGAGFIHRYTKKSETTSADETRAVDLSGYYDSAKTDALLAEKADADSLQAALAKLQRMQEEIDGAVTIFTISSTQKREYDLFQACVGVTCVDWGDGEVSTRLTHEYAEPGDYVVRVYGCTELNIDYSDAWYLYGVAKIGNTVTTIGENGLMAPGLSRVQIPDSLTTIREGAFATCGASELTIPGSVKRIEDRAFEGMFDLQEIVFEHEPWEVDELEIEADSDIFCVSDTNTDIKRIVVKPQSLEKFKALFPDYADFIVTQTYTNG